MLPYYPFYWGDYSAKTLRLTLLERGVYMMLLQYVYVDQKPILHLSRYDIGNAKKKHEKICVDKILNQYFYRDGEVWRNKRADEIINTQHQRHDNLVKSGSIGAAKRWEKEGKNEEKRPEKQPKTDSNPIGKPNGNPYSNQNQNQIHSINTVCEGDSASPAPPTRPLAAKAGKINVSKKMMEKKKNGKPRPSKPAGTKLSPSWRPSSECIAKAEEIGISARDRTLAEQRFRDHYINRKGAGQTSLDWNASFIAWCAGDVQKASAGSQHGGASGAIARPATNGQKKSQMDIGRDAAHNVLQKRLARKRQEQEFGGLRGEPQLLGHNPDKP